MSPKLKSKDSLEKKLEYHCLLKLQLDHKTIVFSLFERREAPKALAFAKNTTVLQSRDNKDRSPISVNIFLDMHSVK